MPKRIFAVVSDETFYAFRRRANLECMGPDGEAKSAMGKCLAALAYGFADNNEANAMQYLKSFEATQTPNDDRLSDVEHL